MELLKTSLAEIAQQLPGASAVLNQFDLSFCCGGKITLEEALKQKNLPQKEVINALNHLLNAEQLRSGNETVQEDNNDWSSASNQELINHLLIRYHQVHRQQLAEAFRLADKVERVHPDNPSCPHGLAAHLVQMTNNLEDHMQKEEKVLFPMILSGRGHLANGPIHVMRLDHEDHAIAINQIEQMTDNLSLPRGACNTWRALYLGLEAMIKDLRAHIVLENDILFTRSLTSSVAATETGEFSHG
jgi:regulator of cell morphogenesis and NO signaling